MDPIMLGILGIIVLFLLLAMGVYIGIALGLVGFAGLVILLGFGPAINVLSGSGFYYVSSPGLIVMPIFALMGLAAMYGGISDATFNAISRITGGLPGGLAIAVVIGCAGFGAVCGTSAVTAVVFAKAAAPQMREYGYNKRFSYGLISCAGNIGMLIPPSMFAVIYGVFTQESIGGLLVAGIGPGLLLAVLYCTGVIIMVRLWPELAPLKMQKHSWKERLTGLRQLWRIALPAAVVIGGIYGGIFTATEAGACGTLIVLLVSFIWGGMGFKQLWNILLETMGVMAMISLVIVSAQVFSRFIVVTGVGGAMVDAIVGFNPTTWQLLIGMIILYMILGCFLDGVSMLSITLPTLYPVVQAMNIEPMWFAMVAIMAMETGLITPPIGFNVYAVKGVAQDDVSLEDIFIGVLPFLFMMVLAIIIIIIFPGIANWLPQHMGT